MSQEMLRWELRPQVANHSLPKHVPPVVARVLASRGIDTAEKLQFFLQPPHRLPYDSVRLKGVDQALQRLYQAIQGGEKVGIFGDFDLDGVSGTAIIAEALNALGATTLPYLPHRVDEGHGLSKDALKHLADAGASLVVTVDCGVTSVSEVAEARRMGMEVIITDHHTPQSQLPEASAVINPKLPGVAYPFLELSGAGVAFKLMQGLYQFYGQPWNRSLLELAVLGTIADLVPLVDENRFIVQQGLKELSRTRRQGLLALYRRAGITPGFINTESVSFQIAPRLNAPGRIGHAIDSFNLLTTSSESEAEALADKLEALNQSRRELTETAFTMAVQLVRQRQPLPSMILVADSTFTPAINGLVAGRLVEMFHRPSAALSLGEDAMVASVRSIPEFNIVEALDRCQDLLLRYGGHARAAGFTVSREKLPLLEARLNSLAGDASRDQELQPKLIFDTEAKLSDWTPEAFQWLVALEPFGMANHQPVFLTRGVRLLESWYVGKSKQHLKLRLSDGVREWPAVAFNQAERWDAEYGSQPKYPYIDLVYTISNEHWQDKETWTLKALHLEPSSG